MRPILLKAGERSVTAIKYSRDGDLIWSSTKSPIVSVWYTSNGERLGTYHGHTGTVWSLDIDRVTERMVTGSGDNNVKLWEVETGRELNNWKHKAPVRVVRFSYGDAQMFSVTDAVLGFVSSIYIYDFKTGTHAFEIPCKTEAKTFSAAWSNLNREIVTAHDDGAVRIWDVRTGGLLETVKDHTKSVMQISYNEHQTLYITASKDGSAKLYDAKEHKCLKTYYTGRPVNSAALSPIKEEVLVGGGQDAIGVTTTRVDNAQFRPRFFHMIFEEDLGEVSSGHFGPVNILSYSPDGKGFASGGEDGYVRLHHFDANYFSSK